MRNSKTAVPRRRRRKGFPERREGKPFQGRGASEGELRNSKNSSPPETAPEGIPGTKRREILPGKRGRGGGNAELKIRKR